VVVNPVLQLRARQEVMDVCRIPRHQDMVARQGLRGNEDIGVALPGVRLIRESPCDGERLLVKVQDKKARQEGLRLPEELLRMSKS
jgi:hypothetical protein